MTKQRRSFSAEFKHEAAGLVFDQGYSHIEASRSLGLVEPALPGVSQKTTRITSLQTSDG